MYGAIAKKTTLRRTKSLFNPKSDVIKKLYDDYKKNCRKFMEEEKNHNEIHEITTWLHENKINCIKYNYSLDEKT